MARLRYFLGDTLIDEKINAILGLTNSVFFEYDYEQEHYTFFNDKELRKISKKELEQYILETQDVLEEDKRHFVDFLFQNTLGEADYRIYDLHKNVVYKKVVTTIVQDTPNCQDYMLGCIYPVEYIREPSFCYGDVNGGIVTYAHDILANTKDIHCGIYMLLDQIGKYFNGCYVSVLECQDSSELLEVTYIWDCRNKKRAESNLKSNVFNFLTNDKDKIFNKKGQFLLNYNDILEHKELRNHEIVKTVGIKGFLGSALFEEGNISGCICVGCYDEQRIWTQEDVETLAAIGNILSGYLLKLRSTQKIDARLEHQRNYDELTGIATLYKFKSDVKEFMYQYPNRKYAMVSSDIGNFKYINDTLGYEKGDQILCDYAYALTAFANVGEAVSRTTADNFMLFLIYEDKESLIQRIEEFNIEFARQQKEIEYRVNIIVISGAAIVEDGNHIVTAIDNANIARKHVKVQSRTICKLYKNEMTEKINREIEIANSMEYALGNNEFTIYLQPKVNVMNNELAGAEALVRWIKPNGEIVYPDEFIPQFETNGFIVNVDFYVYELTCKTIREWIDEGFKVIPISVNVSRLHLKDNNFVEDFHQLVCKYDIPVGLIELELTETIFLDETERALSTLKEFRELGYSVSIDDFGAGYSSLNLLKDMQTDVLKIDREFFRQGDLLHEEKIIVSTIINMAKQLNMKVLSEGIETQKQSEFLKEISCDMAQGYFYSRPMPIEQFKNLMIDLNLK